MAEKNINTTNNRSKKGLLKEILEPENLNIAYQRVKRNKGAEGGPLSPLLANIMLHELDKKLQKRQYWFVRYADDIVILCKSKASAEQTMEHIIPYIEKKLFLRVNREKSKVSHVTKIKFLGYGFYKDSKGYQMRVHKKSMEKMKEKVRQLTNRNRSHKV